MHHHPSRFGNGLNVVWLLALVSLCHAFSRTLSDDDPILCEGMFASSDVAGGGKFNPSISISFDSYQSSTVTLSILVYNILSDSKVGLLSGRGPPSLCSVTRYNRSFCDGDKDWGMFMVDVISSPAPVLNQAFTFGNVSLSNATSNGATVRGRTGAKSVEYPISVTGFYCIYVAASQPSLVSGALSASPSLPSPLKVTFTNPFGLMPASEYPKLPFFGTLSIIYLLMGIVWLIASFRVWRTLLLLQHYICLVLGFLAVEMAFNYGYYEDFNTVGSRSLFLNIICTALNAARNSISLFMLLIVSLGFGVVKPTLGSVMNLCVGLAFIHFLFGLLYSCTSTFSANFDSGDLLVYVLPLSISITIFYAWTMTGLRNTMNTLRSKRQVIKLQMYQRLQTILIVCGVALFVFLLATMFIIGRMNSLSWLPMFWRVQWFLSDGFSSIVYLFTFVSIAILWRPTTNNERYGLDQLGDFDDGDDGEGDGSVFGDAFELQHVVHPHQPLSSSSPVRNGGRLRGEGKEDSELDLEDPESIMKWVEEHTGNGEGDSDGDDIMDELPPQYRPSPAIKLADD